MLITSITIHPGWRTQISGLPGLFIVSVVATSILIRKRLLLQFVAQEAYDLLRQKEALE
jgi:hypothetical protein